MITIRSTIQFKGRRLGQLLGYQAKGSSGVNAQRIAESIKREISENIEAGAEKVIKVAGAYARDRVRERTIGGKDARGKPFKKYTTAYQKRKAKLGKYRGKVDLMLSGGMLGSVEFLKLSTLRGIIYLKNERGRFLGKIHHRGEGKQPKRPFFDWHKGSADDKRLMDVVRYIWREHTRAQAGRR